MGETSAAEFKHWQMLISLFSHREKIYAELNPPTPKTDFCSTTQKDFCVEGFVPLKPDTTQVCNIIYFYFIDRNIQKGNFISKASYPFFLISLNALSNTASK